MSWTPQNFTFMNQKLSILFYQKKSKTDRNGKAPIYVRITIDGVRADFSSGIKVEPKLWNAQRQKVEGKRSVASNYNERLDSIKTKIQRQFNIMDSQDQIINPNELAKIVRGKDESKHKLLEAFNAHNKEAEQRIGHDITKSTYKRYLVTYGKVEKFIRFRYNKQDIFLEDVNHAFINNFDLYLKTHDNNSHNTATKHLTILKKVILRAIAVEWMSHNPYRNFKFSYQETKKEALTMEEIEKLKAKKFASNRLEKVRDIFVFCIYTGLSYSDVTQLTDNNIQKTQDGKKMIVIYRKKTGHRSPIPLLKEANEILEKYKDNPETIIRGTLLPVSSNQRLNEYLKEIADVCGINKHLTMHIARHTFATTITLANGVPIESVGKMLGHSSLKTTMVYAKVTDQKLLTEMGNLSSVLEN